MLHKAAADGDVRLCRLLVSRGASLADQDILGRASVAPLAFVCLFLGCLFEHAWQPNGAQSSTTAERRAVPPEPTPQPGPGRCSVCCARSVRILAPFFRTYLYVRCRWQCTPQLSLAHLETSKITINNAGMNKNIFCEPKCLPWRQRRSSDGNPHTLH